MEKAVKEKNVKLKVKRDFYDKADGLKLIKSIDSGEGGALCQLLTSHS